jgi:hypothetical protein
MSYWNRIKGYLNLPGEQESDFYIKATQKAMSAYLNDIKRALCVKPIFEITGTVVVGNTSYSVMNVPAGKLKTYSVSKPSYLNIKTALWTKKTSNSFPNLFALIGRKITQSFIKVTADPMVQGTPMPIILNTAHFRSLGYAFIAKIKSDTTKSKMTPEKFHKTLGKYIEKGIKQITPLKIPISGAWSAGGVFTGYVSVNLSNAKFI